MIHLSTRLAWDDDGWDGCVCQAPHLWPFFVPPEWENDFDLQTVIQTEDMPAHSRGVLHITNVQQFYERGRDEAPENPILAQMPPRLVKGEEFKSRATLYDILGRYDQDGILRHYRTDFIVKTEEGYYLIETEGMGFEEMASVALKDALVPERLRFDRADVEVRQGSPEGVRAAQVSWIRGYGAQHRLLGEAVVSIAE